MENKEDVKSELGIILLLVQQLCDQVVSRCQQLDINSSEEQYYETLHEFSQSVKKVAQNNHIVAEDTISDFSDCTSSGYLPEALCDKINNSEVVLNIVTTTSKSTSPLLNHNTHSCHEFENSYLTTSSIIDNDKNSCISSICTSHSNSESVYRKSSEFEMSVEESSCEVVSNSAESLFPPTENKNCFDINDTASTTHLLSKPIELNLELDFPKLVAESCDFGMGNFLKGCKWAPDGLCFLSNTNDNYVKIFNTPYECLTSEINEVKDSLKLDACLMIKESGTVYDYCWWPLMNSNEPVTCCFATASSDHPIHLWDAFNGKLRASYIALNSVQELSSPYSLCFSNDGRQLLCGFKKDVCLYYTDRPGAHYERWSTMKKKQRLSQNNIISCMEFCQDDTMFACGSYDGTVGLYSPVNGHLLDFTAAHSAGVTWLKFSVDGYRLYTGARKENLLKCWDIRNLRQPISCMLRRVSTNQRIYFDTLQDRNNQLDLTLVSGSTDGNVYFFDIAEVISKFTKSELCDWEIQDQEPKHQFKAHDDCVNGCSLHPFLPLLLTASGQRKYPDLCEDDDCDVLTHKTKSGENKVKMWHLTGTKTPLLAS